MRCLCMYIAVYFMILAGACSSEVRTTNFARGKVSFNQQYLESNWSQAENNSTPKASRSTIYQDPRAVLHHVLVWLPDNPVVYPSEMYYYFEFLDGPHVLSGNLRFTDAHNGVLHMGYFDRTGNAENIAKSWSEHEGVQVRFNPDDSTMTIRFEQHEKRFRIFDPPTHPADATFADEPDLVFVTGLIDESGFHFDLFFSAMHNTFFYTRRSNCPFPAQMHVLDETSSYKLLMDSISRFVFLEQTEAPLILVGVDLANVVENNYYDGPFDQIPPRLPIKALLERAYPYVVYRGGINEHGEFIELSAQRVAISPYLQYGSVSDIRDHVVLRYEHNETGVSRWIGVTREWKQDFSPRVPPPWPANHQVEDSSEWPRNHTMLPSRLWPANHNYELTAQQVAERRGRYNTDE